MIRIQTFCNSSESNAQRKQLATDDCSFDAESSLLKRSLTSFRRNSSHAYIIPCLHRFPLCTYSSMNCPCLPCGDPAVQDRYPFSLTERHDLCWARVTSFNYFSLCICSLSLAVVRCDISICDTFNLDYDTLWISIQEYSVNITSY